MRHYFTILTLWLCVAGASAQTYERPIGRQKPVRATPPPPPISQRENVQGAIPRGVRGGNPLQLLNPKAPAKYGTAAQSVMLDEAGKWRGIKLFEIFW